MKTSELNGAALDYAVAKCKGVNEKAFLQFYEGDAEVNEPPEFHYATDWALAGPIIEREGLGIDAHLDREEWIARDYWGMHEQSGATPLIAAMRCYVASKLGDEVQIPGELSC